MPNQYVTPDEVFALTNQSVTDEQCRAATAEVERNGIFYNVVSRTQRLRNTSGDELNLRDYPVMAITSLSLDGISIDVDTVEILDQSVEPGMIFREDGFSASRLVITYSYGFSEVPTKIKTATARIAAILSSSGLGIKSETSGTVKVDYSESSEKEIDSILKTIPRRWRF